MVIFSYKYLYFPLKHVVKNEESGNNARSLFQHRRTDGRTERQYYDSEISCEPINPISRNNGFDFFLNEM